jgi:preprotein translocase subunit SecG
VKNLFNIITVVSAVLMVVTILVQNRGQSLGAAFGADSGYYRSKRGAELVVFNASIVLSVVFVLSVVLSILSKS